MHRTRRLRSLVVLAALAPLLAAPRSGAAIEIPGPWNQHAAHFCQGSEDWIERATTRLSNGSTTMDAWLQCPIVSQDFGVVSGATVRVVNQHYDLDVTCTLLVIKSDLFTPTAWFSTKTTSGSEAAVKTLTFGPLGANLAEAHHMKLECQLPRKYAGNKSSLISYTVGLD